MSDVLHLIPNDCWLKKPPFWPMGDHFEEDAVWEQVGRVWKSALFDVRRFSAISEFVFENFFLWINGVWIFPLPFHTDHTSTYHSHLFSKLKESTQKTELLTRKEVEHAVRTPLRSLSKVEYFPLVPSSMERFKKRIEPSQRIPQHNWTSRWWIDLSFSFGGGGVSIIFCNSPRA